MAQFKIYGRLDHLRQHHQKLGELIHDAAVRTLKLPTDKRFQRFIPLDDWQLVAPVDRSPRYTLIEVLMFTGRAVETRKALLRALMEDIATGLEIPAIDIEITIIESPRENWGIRGQTGDELSLSYKVDV